MSVIPLLDDWTCRVPRGPFAALANVPSEARIVQLPHDATRDGQRRSDVPGRGATGYFPEGAFTYVRQLKVPMDWVNRLVQLEVQGAFRRAQVFVNDELAGNRADGYARFFVDITPFLRYGASNELRIEVRSGRDSRWYSGTGLHRPVFLHVNEATDIVPDGVTIGTLSVDEEQAVLEVRTMVRNASMVTRTTRIGTRLTGPDGADVADGCVPLTLAPGEAATARQVFYLRGAQLWSPTTPLLHTARSTLDDQGHTVTTQFGIRTISVDPHRGLRINGEPLLLRGACVHHDNGPLGAAAFDRAEERRVELLKAAGFNAIRASHNPLSLAMIEACDRLGVLVIDEAFDMWTRFKTPYDYAAEFPQWWAADLESMVAKDRNHPSVIMYSTGNEIAEIGTPHGARWSRRLADHLRSLDPTRPVTSGFNVMLAVLEDLPEVFARAGVDLAKPTSSALNDMGAENDLFSVAAVLPEASARIEEAGASLDVVGLNYADSRYELDAAEYPNRVLVGSETYPSHIGRLWPMVQRYPHVIGDFTWTGWDYLGEVGIGSISYESDGATGVLEREFPFLTAWTGDLDITGHRRPVSYYREIVFGLRTKPYIAVQRAERVGERVVKTSPWAWSDSISSWTWNGYEGTTLAVEVYSAAEEVALFIDGVEIARTHVGDRLPRVADFEVAYQAGELTAVDYVNGQEQERTSLRTASTVRQICMAADRHELLGSGQDLTFVSIELHDEHGQLVTGSDIPVTIDIDGPAVLAGMCSANPKTNERFDANTWTTFDGRALAVVRATGVGSITMTASASGLASTTLKATASPRAETTDHDTSKPRGAS